MAYDLARHKARYGDDNADNALIYQLVIDGLAVTPTAATLSIFRRGESAALVTDDDMTIAGTLATYEIDASDTDDYPIDVDYRAVLSLTYGGVVYQRVVLFDVARFLFNLAISVEHIIALDPNVRGMIHDGDPEFAQLLLACRSVIQAQIETKILSGKQLVENVILDHDKIAIAARFYILSRIFFNASDFERYAIYTKDYDLMLAAMLSTLQYDKGQDGDTDGDIGGIQTMRFML